MIKKFHIKFIIECKENNMVSKVFDLETILDLNVATIASMFKALFIRNMAAMIYSVVVKSFCR